MRRQQRGQVTLADSSHQVDITFYRKEEMDQGA